MEHFNIDTEDQAEPAGPGRHSRRDFLVRGAGGAAVLGAGGLLGAIGSTTAGASTSRSPSSTLEPERRRPRRGGTITFASTGGGSGDTLDANGCVSNLDFARAPQLYDTLAEPGAHSAVKLHLLKELTANRNATEWTFRLRSGIEFHNGKELTIDDVLFTFQRIITNKFSAASALSNMNLAHARKLDRYTARIPMHRPYSIMPVTLIGNGEVSIVPVGYDPKHPVGTGPFKFSSFTPGQRSVFTRNPHYFLHGHPYVDELVIDDYSDETSQVNALLSGQATCVDQLSIGSVQTIRSGGRKVNIWDGPGWVPFTMRLDQRPFNDVRVRQAMRYIIDRHQAREVVFGGYGKIGNDIFGVTTPSYGSSHIPQRQQDIQKAKFLLKKAGHEHLHVNLTTAPIKTGAVELAEVIKQNASAAGITIGLNQITSGTFFGPSYTNWTFAQDWWSGYPY
ncbi:MAG: ABC transporter substrate-binding protein, partial [Acidimicrobiales bacterium]